MTRASASTSILPGVGALDEALGRADHVCLTLPLTPATHHLMDARRLARMGAGRVSLQRVARRGDRRGGSGGGVARGQARGRGAGRLQGGAAPAGSPLWELENVILTPHVAGVTPLYYQRTAALFADNLERFLAGRPLANEFEPASGGIEGRCRIATNVDVGVD